MKFWQGSKRLITVCSDPGKSRQLCPLTHGGEEETPPFKQRRAGLARYCLSYTAVLLTFLPAESLAVLVTVRVLPSAETETLPLIVTFPPFVAANVKVWSSTCL